MKQSELFGSWSSVVSRQEKDCDPQLVPATNGLDRKKDWNAVDPVPVFQNGLAIQVFQRPGSRIESIVKILLLVKKHL